MGVYEINNDSMLRVARSVSGKARQTYISLVGLNKKQRAQALKEAKALDAKWAADQNSSREDKFKKSAAPRGHKTGVQGINAVFRPALAYRVQAMTDGKKVVREFSTKRYGHEKAWKEAKKCLADARGLARVPAGWPKTPPKPRKPKK